jgi:hypothetical protein
MVAVYLPLDFHRSKPGIKLPVTNHHAASSRKSVPTSNTMLVTKRTINGLTLAHHIRNQTTTRSWSPLTANASTKTSGVWLTNVHIEWAATTDQKN